MKSIRILVADDHVVVRKGIQMIVSIDPSIQIVGEARNGSDAVHLAKILCPDVILMDLVMPGCDGIEATATIKEAMPEVKIIILATFGDENRVEAAIKAGADGFLLKDTDDSDMLLSAIQNIQRGYLPFHPQVACFLIRGGITAPKKSYAKLLTEREREVLQLMARGLSNKDMARSLNVARGTVKIHVSNILGKLQASSRTEAVVYALERGLVPRGPV